MIAAILSNWRAIACAAALLTAFGTGWTVNQWRWEAGEAAELRRSIDRGAENAAGLEIQLELLQRKARETNRRYANEVRKDSYRCPFLLTASACSTKPELPPSLTAECPELEPVAAKDMGDLLGVCIDTASLYNQCRARHAALAAAVKPASPFDPFGWFR